jgi:hypothetical protein
VIGIGAPRSTWANQNALWLEATRRRYHLFVYLTAQTTDSE